MKRLFLVIYLSVIVAACAHNRGLDNSIVSSSKVGTYSNGYPEVKVANWKTMKMVITDGVWAGSKNEIVAQIGEEGFEKVKTHYDYKSVPAAMSLASEQNVKNQSRFYEKLQKLKVFKIATFTQWFEGKNWGRLGILQVPYKGNETWDATAVWDTVYLIVSDSVIVKP
jgi:hypothetical protein